jgi:hypothetical protein
VGVVTDEICAGLPQWSGVSSTSSRKNHRRKTMKDVFIQAIHKKQKVRVTFFSKEDSGTVVRKCAPMDYGPSRRANDKSDRFHMWDYESDTGTHTLSLKPEQVKAVDILDETFDPAEFVTWRTAWFVERDWGAFS